MTKPLSVGKYRALQQASTSSNHFAVLAIDHQDSLKQALNPQAPATVTDGELVAFKHRVVTSLWHEVSGLLLDPVFGLIQAIDAGLPPQVGLLVELEKADYNLEPLPLAVEIRTQWSVARIKRMGAQGVKLFYYYDPDDTALCEQQDATIAQVVADCARYDIPLYAEPIITNGTTHNRQQKIIASALRAQALGVDMLKLEFPVDVTHEQDIEIWKSACQALSDCLEIPWVLLSAGVSFDVFQQQVEVACQAGASGYIVGRAVWGDATTFDDVVAQTEWLLTTGRERLQMLSSIVEQYAMPWLKHYALPDTSTRWYLDYADFESE